MKRPSFQFYPGDWSANPNLKRCTFAEKGIWLEVMCLMHDQAEYGVLRWPLKEIAEAVKCRLGELQALQRKGVLKGSDTQLTEAFIYVPRSGRKDGEPVTLVATQAGPIWYSSRMVKDEHVRTIRAEGGILGDAPKPPKGEAKGAPKGPRGSSSSSSPSGSSEANASAAGAAAGVEKTPEELTKAELWEAGKSLLLSAGVPKGQCGSFLGKLVQDYGDQIAIEAVRAAVVATPADPREYLKATCQRLKGERKDAPPPSTVESKAAEHTAELLRQQAEHAKRSTPPPDFIKKLGSKAGANT